ncbi:MAG: Ni/Fe hydrogenase subunit alpha, partial [Gaiellaceae bacterium]
MRVVLEDGEVAELELSIYEPPRFFEALLQGRAFTEAPDITARICGICPVAYQMSAVLAMEDACDVEVPEPIRQLRRLLYCGEWLQSHGLHVYMLHAPDFLGYTGVVDMARDHADVVTRGLMIKKVGNELMRVVGGRAVHPVNVKVGGFYKAPATNELLELRGLLEQALAASIATVAWTADFDFPDLERDIELVALKSSSEYPIDQGEIASDRGLRIAASEYDEHFVEEQVARSNALHSRRRNGSTYLTGPLARYALNAEHLSAAAQTAAASAGLGVACRNPFQSIVVRSVEMVYACEEALRIIDEYEPPDPPAIEVVPVAGTGHGTTEAPRGLLYHRYRIDDAGTIIDAKIVPPTSQNQRAIEADLHEVVGIYRDLDDKQLGLRCEQTIRNYDPCIS